MDTTGTITVARTLDSDVGIRHVMISVDGKRIAALEYGQTVTRTISAGPHELRADNTLVRKTLAFEVRPGQHVRFVTSNRPGFLTFLIWLLGAGPIYVTLAREEDGP